MGHAVSAKAVAAAGVILAERTVLAGLSIRNTHATNTGVFRIYDNATAATGTILYAVSLVAGATSSFEFPGTGVQAINGLFLDITNSATVEGSVHID